jgi:hypothetical protein
VTRSTIAATRRGSGNTVPHSSEGLVTGDDEAGPLVAGTDELEEEVGGLGRAMHLNICRPLAECHQHASRHICLYMLRRRRARKRTLLACEARRGLDGVQALGAGDPVTCRANSRSAGTPLLTQPIEAS